MSRIQVLVNGAGGRMGSLTAETVAEAPDLELVGRTERTDDLTQALARSSPDIMVDFTVPEAVFDCAITAVNAGVRPVIGTSGLGPEQIEELTRRCEERGLGGVLAPNFALGAVLLMRLAATVARHLGPAEIIEMHHDRKRDAPSFTALRTAELMEESRRSRPDGPPPVECGPGHDHEARGALHSGVQIHSVRLPGLLAHQEVIFGAPGQTLTLRHDTLDRRAFMPGVLLAIRRAPGLTGLVRGLEHLIP